MGSHSFALLTEPQLGILSPSINELGPDMRSFLDSARLCYDSACERDFAVNDACQKAWNAQAKIKAQTPADNIPYFQARLMLNRAYETALERRLGQSAYSTMTCADIAKPLSPL